MQPRHAADSMSWRNAQTATMTSLSAMTCMGDAFGSALTDALLEFFLRAGPQRLDPRGFPWRSRSISWSHTEFTSSQPQNGISNAKCSASQTSSIRAVESVVRC